MPQAIYTIALKKQVLFYVHSLYGTQITWACSLPYKPSLRCFRAASSAAGTPAGSLPPAVARLGRPPPPPPHSFANDPASAPAFSPFLSAPSLTATAMATLPPLLL